MTVLSVRGLNTQALAELKRRAAREEVSVNTLVVELIEKGLGLRRAKSALRRHDDLDVLAGSWNKSHAAAFERNTAAFSEVDAGLWK